MNNRGWLWPPFVFYGIKNENINCSFDGDFFKRLPNE